MMVQKKKMFFLMVMIFASMSFHSPLCSKEVFEEEYKCCYPTRSFGGWSICKKLYNTILKIIPQNGTLLELGSGWTSGELSKKINVWSVEHNQEWLHAYQSNYIYAPIKDGWYSVEALLEKMPEDYDLILVDGPPGEIGRRGFLNNIQLFRKDVPIIFDDVHRNDEYRLMLDVAKVLKRRTRIIKCGKKKFGIILLDSVKR